MSNFKGSANFNAEAFKVFHGGGLTFQGGGLVFHGGEPAFSKTGE